MCGIAGIFYLNRSKEDRNAIKKMTDALIHRGPDAEGQWSNDAGLYLGHRRLSIIDLDPRSNQPFEWLNRFVITFNGEIYNYIEVREQLKQKGYFFATNSDTEVICAAYNEWKEECLQYFDGMFAFALYDKNKQTLFCARDRFGEKPFFFHANDEVFYFASEMKAMWQVRVRKDPRKDMMHQFLIHGMVEDVAQPERTFYEAIFQLKPGHFMKMDLKGKLETFQKQYYFPNIKTTFNGTYNEAVLKFRALLEESVIRRMRADVQLGSSLSGGLDSSAITRLMAFERENNYSFSARFPGFAKDEGVFIEQVATQCQTKHVNVYPKHEELLALIDKMLYHHEEPFQSASVFAQYSVYASARKENVLVLLDGQGADELLAGYFKFLLPYYFELKGKSNRLAFITRMNSQQGINLQVSKKDFIQFKFPKIFKLISDYKSSRKHENFKGLGMKFQSLKILGNPFLTQKSLKASLRYNLTQQGLGKLLRFSDRNAMANSIEVRLPFLSHEVVDFVMSLPSEFFFQKGWTKSILRDAMAQDLPPTISWRKDKVGFEAPDQDWLLDEKYQDALQEAKKSLISQGWITEEYTNAWNTIILYRLLQSVN